MSAWRHDVDDVPPEWIGERIARWLILCALTLLVFTAMAVGTYVIIDVALELAG